MSEIRTLKDGETQIAPRTVAKAVSTVAGKTVEAALGEAAAQIATMQKLKRNNIMGSYPVKTGQTIHAGDVVDVVGGEVGKTWRAEANVENMLNPNAATGTATLKLNTQYSVVALLHSSGDQHTTLVDNTSGRGIVTIPFYSGVVTNVSLDRLSDTKFVVGYSTGTYLYAKIGTISGTTITFGTETIISYKSGTTTYHNALISFSETSFLAVYYRTGTGLAARMCTVSGTGITTGSEYVSVSGLTESLSATRLPDLNSNKRVCVCFSYFPDGKNGKAVIATIKPDNTVEWGSVVTFNNASTGYTSIAATPDGDAIVMYNMSTKIGARVLSLSGSMIQAVGDEYLVLNSHPGEQSRLIPVGSDIIAAYNLSSGSGRAAKLVKAGTTLDRKQEYIFNPSPTLYMSGDQISDTKFLVSYADGGNSAYGTATILEVQGDQIAGSFADASSECIALQAATSVQQCEVLFDGVAELPGFTAGTEISSPGVYGYCPEDGRVWVRPEWSNKLGVNCVTGSYMGTGTKGSANPIRLTLGFRPVLVVVTMDGTAQNTRNSLILIKDSPFGVVTYAHVDATWTDAGVSWWSDDQYGAEYQMNRQSVRYRYIAFRSFPA